MVNRLELQHLSYSYNHRDMVLQDVNFTFEDGNIYAIIGKSGAGKTTLLSLLSQLTTPDEGDILYEGKRIKDVDQYLYRSRYVGVIFQSFNLLPNLTAVENVMLSMDIANVHKENNRLYAMELLAQVGLSEDEAQRRILKLSGGQQQRVAIARALSYDPGVILADEPTGNLDQETQEDIMEIFEHLAYEEGKCIILVTHSPQLAKRADHTYELTSSRAAPRKKILTRRTAR